MSRRSTYNEHDRNQVQKILKDRKRKKRKKYFRRFIFLLIIVVTFSFFMSEYSRIQSIKIVGNKIYKEEDIKSEMHVKVKDDITLLTTKNKIKEDVENIPYIESASVKKSLFGNVTITVQEAEIFGYQINNDELWLLYGNGKTKKETMELLELAEKTPKLKEFNEEIFNKFAKQYAKLPSQLRYQVSDISYSPLPSDETRCEFLMDDGKILYLRIEDMVNQLKDDRYASIVEEFPDAKYYDFVGKYCYAK